MGLFEVDPRIANPASPERTMSVRLLVDTGATLSALPASVLHDLGIQPGMSRTFVLASGERIQRRTGSVLMSLDGITMPVPVMFAEGEDSPVLGVTALEILGFVVDPVERKLVQRDLLALESELTLPPFVVL